LLVQGNSVEPLTHLMHLSVRSFAKHLVLLVENDSSDCTAERMRLLCKQDLQQRTHCLNLVGLKARDVRRSDYGLRSEYTEPARGVRGEFGGSARFAKMAMLRNLVLMQVERLRAYDLFAFVDGDLLQQLEWLPTGIQVAALKKAAGTKLNASHSLRWGGLAQGWAAESVLGAVHRADTSLGEGKWSGVCFYSTFGESRWYYDALALRVSNSTPLPALARAVRPDFDASAWNAHLSTRSELFSRTELHLARFAMAPDQRIAHVPVRSCCGGLAVYSLHHLRQTGCHYDERGLECEHVSLNECLSDRLPDSLFIDPQAPIFYDSTSAKATQRPQ